MFRYFEDNSDTVYRHLSRGCDDPDDV